MCVCVCVCVCVSLLLCQTSTVAPHITDQADGTRAAGGSVHALQQNKQTKERKRSESAERERVDGV